MLAIKTMEPQPHAEHVLPGEHYWNVFQQITEAKPETPLNAALLDELLQYGTQHYKQEAQKSEEFHEDFGMAFRTHFIAEQGSYYEEKPHFCENFAKGNMAQAIMHEKLGNTALAHWHRTAASNWYRLAAACLLMPEARPQPPLSPTP